MLLGNPKQELGIQPKAHMQFPLFRNGKATGSSKNTTSEVQSVTNIKTNPIQKC